MRRRRWRPRTSPRRPASSATPGGGMNAAAPAKVYDPRYARVVLGILAGMALMVTYVETMVLPAFSNFESFFRVTDASTIAWILSAYLLVGVVVTPIFGKL